MMETLESMRAGRVYTDDIARDAGVDAFCGVKTRGYLYFWVHNGAFWVEELPDGRYLATVCNGEHLGTLAECESFLWEHWVRAQVNQ
jgi:hypothetical protein